MELEAAKAEQDDLRMTIKRLYRCMKDQQSAFGKAIHAQIQGWDNNVMRE
jgi:hypothetical protein